MSDLGFDSLAARALARKWRRQGAVPPASEAERAAAIAAMTAALRRGRRWRVMGAGVAVAAAASIVLALGARGWRLPGSAAARRVPVASVAGAPERAPTVATVVPGDRFRPWRRGDREVSAGERFVARSADRVFLSSAAGSELWLDGESELGVQALGSTERFRLARGQVHAEVAPLRASERFVIETRDAEVEVRGTAFDVTLAPPDPRCRGGVATRVAVGHGMVEVRSGGRDERVAAGERWPPECASVAATAGAKNGATSRAAAGETRPSRGAGRREALGPGEPRSDAARRSTLEAQNDLLAAALASERRGEPEQALVELDELLARWPASPMAETAMAERIRLLTAGGESRAATRAAREYLRRFPDGSARSEAERLVGGQAR